MNLKLITIILLLSLFFFFGFKKISSARNETKNQNIEEALKMLREANDLKKNNGYITDSLGWALFKTKNFSEAKKYLQIAIMLMPRATVINDHFADCLWMNDNKIQARYYWNNALEFDADDKLKKQIKRKILFGLENI